jgi:hypothetical protein
LHYSKFCPSHSPLLKDSCIHLDAIFRIFPCHFLRLHLHKLHPLNIIVKVTPIIQE